MDSSNKSPKRQAVLIVSWPDGHIEVFGEDVTPLIVRVPVAHTREGEAIAEECMLMGLPRRYRELFRRDFLRAVGTSASLSAGAAHASLKAGDAIRALNGTENRRGRVA